jgi:hypothetical protein
MQTERMRSLIEKETVPLTGSRTSARSTGLLKKQHGMTGERQIGGGLSGLSAAANNDHRRLSTWMCRHQSVPFLLCSV